MNIIISNASDQPIYNQIATQIRDQILSGLLESGEQMPSIRVLAKELKISVITTKRAYEELEREGYVETVVGKGTFISSINQSLLKERQMDSIQKELTETLVKVKKLKLDRKEFDEIIDLLWE